MPNIFICPSAFISDNTLFIVVVLPLPFGPKSPRISPLFTSKDKLSMAFKFLYSFVKFLTSITFSIVPPYIKNNLYHVN